MINKNDIYSLEESLIRVLLDIYALSTKLPVALYDNLTDRLVWTTRSEVESPLCRYLMNDPDKNSICLNDHKRRCFSAKGMPEVCHAGLWNIAKPISIKGQDVATFITGQVRIDNEKKSKKSDEIFFEFIKDFSEPEKKKLQDLYKKTQKVEESIFTSRLMSCLADIQDYIEHLIYQKIYDDERRRHKIQNLSHDFLLIIQAILNKAENLKDEIEEGGRDKELAMMSEDVIRETLKLSYFIKNMIGSMMPEGEAESFYEPINTLELLNESISLFQNEACNKGVIIYPPRLVMVDKNDDNVTFPVIDACKDDLSRMFNNLIQNAVKYSYNGGPGSNRYVSVLASNTKDEFAVEISNYGVGIESDEIKTGRIFSDTYRGRHAEVERKTGSGIGLYEVKKILDRHSGRIEVKSDQYEVAYKTVVKVYLPNKTKRRNEKKF